jgi:hypothetical protein
MTRFATLHAAPMKTLLASAVLAGLGACAEQAPLRKFDANAQLRTEIERTPPPPTAAPRVAPATPSLAPAATAKPARPAAAAKPTASSPSRCVA